MTAPSKAFEGDFAIKSRDAIKLHQERYNGNSVISHNIVSSGSFLSTRYSCVLRIRRLMAYTVVSNNSFYLIPLYIVLQFILRCFPYPRTLSISSLPVVVYLVIPKGRYLFSIVSWNFVGNSEQIAPSFFEISAFILKNLKLFGRFRRP